MAICFCIGRSLIGSSEKKPELIVPKEELQKIWILRKLLHPMEDSAIDFLLDKLKGTKDNNELFNEMKRA